jgi:hypothetical protein
MMNKFTLADMKLNELTRQVIACKTARHAEPEYDDWEDFLAQTGSVECTELNNYKVDLLATLRWKRGEGLH